MYETEANWKTEGMEQLPGDFVARLGAGRKDVLARTVLPWSEHCTECVWPTCYSSCGLYEPRTDGKCRRFVRGMVRIDCPDALNSYVVKITFKRWGKLWSPGNVRLHSVERSLEIERLDYRIGRLLHLSAVPELIRKFAAKKRYSIKKRLAYRPSPVAQRPTSFLLECFNPGAQPVSLSLCVRPVGSKSHLPYQKLIELRPGFNRVRVAYAEIARIVDLNAPFNVELIPNSDSDELTLIFGLVEFVVEGQPVERRADTAEKGNPKKVKCVVWDLDNTLWHGVVVEDGSANLVLKEGIGHLIQDLDSRGILNSIASKNNHEEAWNVLKRLGIEEYFLAPQISWGPKSDGILEISRRLNIGLDSLLFVDDSEFERSQVSSALPDVRTLDAGDYQRIASLDECQVPVTAESRERRKMYKVEAERQGLAASFGSDYFAFLRDCEIRIGVRCMGKDNLDRVYELTQRTNQMNFSGNRYKYDDLEKILDTPWLETYVLEVEDRFGSYGVVGFCVVDSRGPVMTDLMFSCRIQSKRVEHAFLSFLIREYISKTGRPFLANYRRSAKNAPSGKVFEDMGMRETEGADGISRLVFPVDQSVPDDRLIRIAVFESAAIE